jgi:hypothetical protein
MRKSEVEIEAAARIEACKTEAMGLIEKYGLHSMTLVISILPPDLTAGECHGSHFIGTRSVGCSSAMQDGVSYLIRGLIDAVDHPVTHPPLDN